MNDMWIGPWAIFPQYVDGAFMMVWSLVFCWLVYYRPHSSEIHLVAFVRLPALTEGSMWCITTIWKHLSVCLSVCLSTCHPILFSANDVTTSCGVAACHPFDERTELWDAVGTFILQHFYCQNDNPGRQVLLVAWQRFCELYQAKN